MRIGGVDGGRSFWDGGERRRKKGKQERGVEERKTNMAMEVVELMNDNRQGQARCSGDIERPDEARRRWVLPGSAMPWSNSADFRRHPC